MIMDAFLMFDGSINSVGALLGTTVNSGVSFTTSAGTDSANIIDVSQLASSAAGKGRDVGIGDSPDVKVAIGITTAFAGTGASMQIVLQTAPDSGSGTPGNWSVINMTPAMPVANLTVGQINYLDIVPGVQKFLKLTYLVTGANMTQGAIIAGIVLDRDLLGPSLGYPGGYSNQYV
jgi:hypothetical protein